MLSAGIAASHAARAALAAGTAGSAAVGLPAAVRLQMRAEEGRARRARAANVAEPTALVPATPTGGWPAGALALGALVVEIDAGNPLWTAVDELFAAQPSPRAGPPGSWRYKAHRVFQLRRHLHAPPPPAPPRLLFASGSVEALTRFVREEGLRLGADAADRAADEVTLSDQLCAFPLHEGRGVALAVWRAVLAIRWQPKGADALAVPSFVVDYSVERASAQLS